MLLYRIVAFVVPLGFDTGGKRTARVTGLTGAVAFILLGVYLAAERFVPGLPPAVRRALQRAAGSFQT